MMTFFDRRFYKTAFDELITFYPRYYRDVREMLAILHMHGWLVDRIRDDIEVVYNDAFIDYMDEAMIERLEAFLGLHAGSRSLEERRNILKTYFIGWGKISATVIKEMIKSFGDVDVDVVFEPFDEEMNNALYITMIQDDELVLDIETILHLLNMRIPAHIRIVLNDTIRIEVDCREQERVFFTNLTMNMYVLYWDYRRLNGKWLLDGSVLLNGFHVPLHMELINRFRSQISESCDVYMAITREKWYLDGTYLLNGEKMLGAETVEEVD